MNITAAGPFSSAERSGRHRQRRRRGTRCITLILAGEALEIVGIEKKIMMGRVGRSAYWLDHDPTRMVEAVYGPTTK